MIAAVLLYVLQLFSHLKVFSEITKSIFIYFLCYIYLFSITRIFEANGSRGKFQVGFLT